MSTTGTYNQKLTNGIIDDRLSNRPITRIGNVVNSRTKIEWECTTCSHIWLASPNSVTTQKSGCPMCFGATKVTDNDIDLRLIGRNIERLSNVSTMLNKMRWRCTICEYIWITAPNSVLNCSTGCPRCIKRVSTPESNWLDSIGVPDTPATRQVRGIIPANIRFIVDGYDPLTNTVYEFWGDYWHGNPSIYPSTGFNQQSKATYGELYHKTQLKRQAILDAGYRLVEIWESEWASLH